MKIMYGARFARPDLRRTVGAFARRITSCDRDCDKRLIRLAPPVKSTLKYRIKGWIGGKPRNLEQHYYSDSDFAGSTGSFAMMSGANSCYPNAKLSNKADLRVSLDTRGRARGHGRRATGDRDALAYNAVRACPTHEGHGFRGQRCHDARHQDQTTS